MVYGFYVRVYWGCYPPWRDTKHKVSKSRCVCVFAIIAQRRKTGKWRHRSGAHPEIFNGARGGVADLKAMHHLLGFKNYVTKNYVLSIAVT